MAAWVWDPVKRRYVTASGAALGQRELIAVRDGFAEGAAQVLTELAGAWMDGALTLDQFAAAFEQWIADTVTSGYLLGRGGAEALTEADIGIIQREIDRQVGHAREMIDEFRRGAASAEQVAGRAPGYAGGSVNAFDQGREGAFGGSFTFPVYPGDGETSCYGNCRCYWVIDTYPDRYEMTWVTEGDGRVCPECAQRGVDYAPLVVPRGGD